MFDDVSSRFSPPQPHDATQGHELLLIFDSTLQTLTPYQSCSTALRENTGEEVFNGCGETAVKPGDWFQNRGGG